MCSVKVIEWKILQAVGEAVGIEFVKVEKGKEIIIVGD